MTTETPKRDWQDLALRVLALGLVVGLSVAVYANREVIARLSTLGYLGVFLVTLLSSATVILPAPSLVLPFTMGAVLSPWLVALAAGLGAALGELTGYLAGYTGSAVIENWEAYYRLHAWMQRRSAALVIFVLAFLPVSLFDLAGIVAGALRMPWWRFLFWCFLGKLLKMLLVALAGAWSLPWFAPGP